MTAHPLLISGACNISCLIPVAMTEPGLQSIEGMTTHEPRGHRLGQFKRSV